jgi:hypothetical protein
LTLFLLDILVVSILVWIGHLIFEDLDETVEDDGDDRAKARSNP